MKKTTSVLMMAAAINVVSFAQADGLYGTHNVDGDSDLESIFRTAGKIEVKRPNGQLERSYSLGNVTWDFAAIVNTDNIAGKDIVVKAGENATIINHATGQIKNYLIGNVIFSVMPVGQLDRYEGEEVVAKTGSGIFVINNLLSERYFVDGGTPGIWHYYGSHPFGTASHRTIVINYGDGLRLYSHDSHERRDYFTNGYSSFIGSFDVNGVLGNELIGRSHDKVIVFKGSVEQLQTKTYAGGVGSDWAVYGSILDTDGKAGNEIILVMQKKVRIIHDSTGLVKDYEIPASVNYSIQTVANMDGIAGAEIQVLTDTNRVLTITDRLGKIQ